MFGTSGFGGTTFLGAGQPQAQTTNYNPMKDFEVMSPPDDSVSCLAFSPGTIPQNFLIAGSWDNNVRCWEVDQTGKTIPKSQQTMQAPVLDVAWSDVSCCFFQCVSCCRTILLYIQDGTKVFMAGCDKMAKMWDLNADQSVQVTSFSALKFSTYRDFHKIIQVAAHEAPIKTCHWIKAPNYSCLMTGSWDKTLKFWDIRSPQPILTLNLPERAYCADVDYPVAVVSTAGRHLIVYQLENTPQEFKRIESPLKYQHRCVSIFRDKKGMPSGFALGSIEGRVAIQYINPSNPKVIKMSKSCIENT